MGVRDRVRQATYAVARTVTRVLLLVGLVLVYFVGVGPTALVMAVFSRRRRTGRGASSTGYWQPAVGYAPDLADAERQS